MASMRMATHRVSRGESLWSIAERYYGRPEFWPLIRSANPGRVAKGGDLILVGTELGIPAAPTREERPQLQGSRGGGGPKGAEAISGDIYPPRAVGSLTGPFGGRPVMGHPEGVPHQGRGQVVGGASGRTPAALCGMPKIKYDLRKLPEAKLYLPIGAGLYLDITLSYKGSFSVAKQGSCSPFTLQRGKYQISTDRVFRELMGDIRFTIPYVNGETFGLHLYGRCLTNSVSLTIKGLNRVAAKAVVQPVKVDRWGWEIRGEVGFEADIRLESRGDPFETIPVLTMEAFWKLLRDLPPIKAEYLLLAGVVIVGGVLVGEALAGTMAIGAVAVGCLVIPFSVALGAFDDVKANHGEWGVQTL